MSAKTDSWLRAAREELDNKTKPPGSLGRLEEIAARLASIQGTLRPKAAPGQIITFAADHGVAEEGVSAYPQAVTAQMLANFHSGGAAINVLARHGGYGHRVVDAGVGRPTQNFARQPAMTGEQTARAIETGRREFRLAQASGIRLLGLGEMGIGNTTSAAALFCALLGLSPEEATGRGTGVGDEALARKIAVIRRALDLHRDALREPESCLAAVGGHEIAAMTGFLLQAAGRDIAVVIDGFVATAAAAAAFAMDPAVREVCFFGHLSGERGHRRVLEMMRAEPLLDLGMRLGEGSGAALAMHLVSAAAAILNEMATFESAGITGRHPA